MNYDISVSGNILTILPEKDLDKNTEYKITISPGLSGEIPPSGETDTIDTEYSFWFSSTYCPRFTTINRVKLQGGQLIENFNDDTIYRMIHKNSVDVIDLYNMSASKNYSYTAWGCDDSRAPIQFKKYVECKTAYDLLSIIRIQSSGAGGQTKKLGDMTISYDGSIGLDELPNRLKDLYKCWNEMMRMLRNIRVAVKGYYDSSKGYSHPVHEFHHNRVIRPVSFNNASPRGPWGKSHDWSGYRW